MVHEYDPDGQEKTDPYARAPRILVTGAAGGLGKYVVSSLVRSHFRVVASGLSKYPLDSLEDQLDLPSNLSSLTADVSSPEEVRLLFGRIHEEHGALHGVVHLVGGYHGGTPLEETSDEVFEQLVEVNLRSTFLVLREALRSLRPTGGGSIVLVGSASALPGVPAPGAAVYAATKAAVASLVESSAAEAKRWSIRVNGIAPGIIRTSANVAAMPTAEHYKWVTPEEVAEVIRFLLSPEGSGVTGALVKVTGRL